MSGTINSGGGEGFETRSSMNSMLQGDGTWKTSGTNFQMDHNEYDYGWSGSGTYAYDVTGGSVNGTLSDGGGNGNSFYRDATENWSEAGSSTITGNGHGGNYSNNGFGYSGSGSYSYAVSGGTVAGTINEGGDQGGKYAYDYEEELDNSGWHLTAGTSINNSHAAANWSYVDSGARWLGVEALRNPGALGQIVRRAKHCTSNRVSRSKPWRRKASVTAI